MPLGGLETYSTTLTEFQTHWGATNAARQAPLVLTDGLTLAALGDLKAQIIAAVSLANTLTDAAGTAHKTYDAARAIVYAQMSEFRRAAAYYLAAKDYAGKILPLPRVTKDDGDLFKAADSYFYAWGMANDDTTLPPDVQPLTLTDGTTLADFQSGVAGLRELQSGISGADNVADTARKVRDGLCDTARREMKAYRKAILALYAPDSVEVLTLPKIVITPKPAPDAPKLKVDYVAGQSTAKLSWVITPDVSLARFYVMMCPGARYSDKNATRLADLDDLAREFDLAQNTIAAGATVWLKVFAVDDDANQTGSNAVKLTRGA